MPPEHITMLFTSIDLYLMPFLEMKYSFLYIKVKVFYIYVYEDFI